MANFYFTFGSGQYGGLFANKYVIINTPTRSEAIDIMVQCFGRVWAFDYTEADFLPQVAKYGLVELGRIAGDAESWSVTGR